MWLVRHAKSDWEQGVADFDRGLNPRGLRDGPFMAEWLNRQSYHAEWIWSSSANRALSTARFVAEGWQLPEECLVAVDTLYHASPHAAFEVLRDTPPSVSQVALVFHNPGITELINLLAGHVAIDNLPTLGIAEFTTDLPWAEVHTAAFKLERIVSPKALRALEHH